VKDPQHNPLDDFIATLRAHGDPILGLAPGDLDKPITSPRYRVTRRGNVYDDLERRTVWATHGLGSIRERVVMATARAAELNAPG